MHNAHDVTRDFEFAVAKYCGAPYAVAVNSCTMALLLSVSWHRAQSEHGVGVVVIPRRTYLSVPMSIIHAGCKVAFRDEEWLGAYRLEPLRVWDSARWFTSGLYPRVTAGGGGMVCLSFHATKTLGIEQGGMILHNNLGADAWLRRARFDGRTAGVAPKDDAITEIGWHAYMNPSTAAQGLMRLAGLKRDNEPLPNDDYPDLSQLPAFKEPSR